MKAKTAKEAYHIIALYLIRNSREKTPQATLKKHAHILAVKVGKKYVDAIELIIRAYFNIQKFVPDGQPMEKLYDKIEEIIN